ncbi:MAG TPA: DUF3127 domain-containing protein [Saprospiraceae bacterium]|jgi:single-strand DNA-binding protein|nr:DUF3127 domain-containing protein [Saprospiraceae bacterium]HRO08817.1 DUF3127 domain-containing protein [Saprospiraceae bacterium]HRO72238.1 DUF3127 domain-containing protein [Saprospiraceae bacterium]HRP42094.1 DUF3127 domain-containing protein [Saprospiraceae bacterium]
MAFEVEGILYKKFDTESKTETFQTREFVIKTDEQYPQFVKFQLVQDKCSAIDNYAENDRIKVSFDLRGREWQDKFFTNLQAWKIDRAGESTERPQESTPFVESTPFTSDFPTSDPATPGQGMGDNASDDLPF